MPFPLLAAKFFQPVPFAGRVKRIRLLRLLEAGLQAQRPLTLVSAPAGYGKSTLVSDWLTESHALIPNQKPTTEGQSSKMAWLSLDEADDEPGRFLLYFVAALQKMEPAFSAELFAVLQAGQLPPLELLVTTLVNEMLDWQNLHLLTLDDFQHIQNPVTLEFLGSLLAHQPRSLHLVLVTREDPALPLARLRARGQLTEIRAADLRFSEPESLEFLRESLGLSLSEVESARLTERTEGWVAGLQLAGLSLQGRENPAALIESLSGSHRFILGYLTEEVLKRQPAEIQDFLLKTSILSRLNGDLCEAVSGESGGEARLEALLAANLFLLPLDDEGRWYRYHHLFAELLQAQLRRSAPGQVADLHRRASAWYEGQALPVEAIEHALAAGETARVTRLLDVFGWSLLNQGYARQMETWLQAIPPEARNHSPRLSLGFGWLHLLRANMDSALAYLRQAQSALAGAEPGEAVNALRAESLALEANLAQSRGDLAASVQAAQAALALAPAGSERVTGLAWLALGGAYRQSAPYAQAAEALEQAAQASWKSQDWITWMLAISHLTLMSIHYGRLRFAAETASRAVEQLAAFKIAPPPIIGAIYGALGLVDLETNLLEAARENFKRGIRMATFSGHSGSLVYNLVNLARLFQAEGDLPAAAQTLEEAARYLRMGAPGWMRPELVYRQTSLLLALGQTAAAESSLHQSDVTPADEVTRRTDWVHLAWLRLLVVQKDPAALPLAQKIIHSAAADGRDGIALPALLLGALAGGPSEWLARALELGEREGYLRVFLDEGVGRLQDEFRRVNLTSTQQAYLDTILAASGENFHPSAFVTRTASLSLPSLTDRELDVLRLQAEGLSYAEIAERLVVSVNTVRYHIKGMYGKLGVEKQIQAVEKGREMGLL